MDFVYLGRVLRPLNTLNIKGKPRHDRSHVASMAQLLEHCTDNAKAVTEFESRSKSEFVQVIFPVVSCLHSHLSFFHYLMVTVGHLLPHFIFLIYLYHALYVKTH